MAFPMEECASAFVQGFARGKLISKDLDGFTVSRDLADKAMSCKRCGQFHVTDRLFKCEDCGAVLCEDQIHGSELLSNAGDRDSYSHPVWQRREPKSSEYECGPCHVISQPLTDEEVLAHFEAPLKKGGPSGGLERFKKYFASKGASKTVVTGT